MYKMSLATRWSASHEDDAKVRHDISLPLFHSYRIRRLIKPVSGYESSDEWEQLKALYETDWTAKTVYVFDMNKLRPSRFIHKSVLLMSRKEYRGIVFVARHFNYLQQCFEWKLATVYNWNAEAIPMRRIPSSNDLCDFEALGGMIYGTIGCSLFHERPNRPELRNNDRETVLAHMKPIPIYTAEERTMRVIVGKLEEIAQVLARMDARCSRIEEHVFQRKYKRW